MKVLIAALTGTVLLAGCAGMTDSSPPIAVANMKPTQGNTAAGTVTFVKQGDQLLMDARLTGLPPGPHGFHIHEKGDCSAPDGSSAGGHFNPSGMKHGSPAQAQHHGGDLGNIIADANGTAALRLNIPINDINVSKNSPSSIVGKGLIVHSDPDDYVTQPTGNAGKRLACGVITLK
ncbi:MAG TPA: superoxide dismutase family protein [Oxalicibacterium sp.]